MSIISQYLNQIKSICSCEELSIKTYHFLKNMGSKVSLLIHKPELNALKIMEAEDQKNLEYWFNKLERLEINSENTIYLDDTFYYYFSSLDLENEAVVIFAVEPNDVCKSILPIWQTTYIILKEQSKYSIQEIKNEHANLISQLLHDIQSLIELNDDNKQELLDRIGYQNRVNENLLFYIRDLDLFKTPLSIFELIRDSLEIIDIKYRDLKISIEDNDLQISVDVELISRAINEIIKNSMHHTGNDYSKIFINVYSRTSNSPLTKYKWLIIEIDDKGKGISEDYLPLVKRPFFTTEKYTGHSGFGLSITEKILKAHCGKIEVNSLDGTNIKLYIPQLSYEHKN